MKAKTKIIALLLAAILIFAVACAPADSPADQTPQGQTNGAPAESSLTLAQEIGEGAKVFRFEVTDGEENVNVWNVNTDAETVGAALV